MSGFRSLCCAVRFTQVIFSMLTFHFCIIFYQINRLKFIPPNLGLSLLRNLNDAAANVPAQVLGMYVRVALWGALRSRRSSFTSADQLAVLETFSGSCIFNAWYYQSLILALLVGM